jgi:hypothetical protein
MSCVRVIVLFVSLLVLAGSLILTEYFLKVLVPQFTLNEVENKKCSSGKVTTDRIDPLLVPRRESELANALRIIHKHGVAFLEDLLTVEQAKALREYILLENLNPKRERAYVSAGENREHLTFGLDENPIITDAVQSIVTSQPLRGVLEKMLGLDAAMVELASITAYPGAKEQDWHEDASQGDRDVALFSLFIPLQKTRKDMGATAMGAGTHICEDYMDDWNKTIHATTKAGTGSFMNCRLYHRGGANTSPDIRVMMYLSFTEERNKQKYRVLPGGATYAIRPDQLGRSLSQIINHSYTFCSAIDFWSKDRGWNYFEMAARNIGDESEIPYFHWDQDEIERKATILQYIVIGLLVLYAVIAEINFFMIRWRNARKQQNMTVEDTPKPMRNGKKKTM